MELTKLQMKKIMFLIAFTILLLAILLHYNTAKEVYHYIINILMPFISGLCIAFIVNVLMKRVEGTVFKFVDKPTKSGKPRKISLKLKRPLSLVLAYLIIFGFIAFLMFQLVPEIQNSVSIIAEKLPDYIDKVKDWATRTVDKYNINPKRIQNLKFDWDKVIDFVTNYKKSDHSSLFGKTMGITSSIFSGFFNFFFGIIFATFILINKEKLEVQCKKLLFAYFKQHKVESFLELCRITNNSFSKFITGQCLDAFIIGLLCFFGMLILKIPYAALVSTLVGVTALIPVIGAFIGTLVGAMLIVLVSPIKALWFIIFIIVLQQFETNLIYPKVVGKSVGLPAIWMLIAATIGGSLYGIVGVILSVPVVSIVYTLLRKSTNKRLEEKHLQIR